MKPSHYREFTLLIREALKLEIDELRVLRRIARRLFGGQHTYGKLQIATDRRAWLRELAEELYDACVYLEIEVMKEDEESLS